MKINLMSRDEIGSQDKTEEISIILPVYKCDLSLLKSIRFLDRELHTSFNNYEIIVVVDGEDRDIVRSIKSLDSSNIKILHYKDNKGKGFAVKLGMHYASGDYIGYIDAGNDIDIKSLMNALHVAMVSKSDIVCGSKLHPESQVINYTNIRRAYTRGYNLLARVLVGIDYKDTQVGLKVYSKSLVKSFLPMLSINRFAFEIEWLAVAAKLGYKNHVDVPVNIEFADRSTATNLTSIFTMVWDTISVAYKLRVTNHYNLNRTSFLNAWREELLKIIFI